MASNSSDSSNSADNKVVKDVSAQVVESLVQAGVKRVFAITGDSLNAVNSAVRENGKLDWISVRHEETGAFAAGAEAQLTGELACCAGSSGPGHVHLVNGLYDCRRSYAPVVAIASTCASNEFGTQFFQETNTTRLFDDCSDYNVVASTAAQVPRMFHEAFQVSKGRNTVSVVALPGDVASATAVSSPSPADLNVSDSELSVSDADLKAVADIFNSNSRITLYCGTGVRYAHEQMVELSRRLNAPVVSTLKGKMFVLYDCENALGCNGAVGNEAGWGAVHDCDVLVMLGNDFPFDYFLPAGKVVVQVDRRAENIGRRLKVTKGVCADMGNFLDALLPLIEQKVDRSFLDACMVTKGKAEARLAGRAVIGVKTDEISPEYVTSVVDRLAADDAVFTVDTGMNCLWAGKYLTATKGRDMIGSFNHGSMANAMPQAIGAQLAFPGRQVVALCGDGGLTMLMGDLLTIVRYKLPVKLIVYNNRSLGFVQMEMEDDKIPVWQTDLDNPDLGKLASDMGYLGITVTDANEVEGAVKRALAYDGPALVNIMTVHNDMPTMPWE